MKFSPHRLLVVMSSYILVSNPLFAAGGPQDALIVSPTFVEYVIRPSVKQFEIPYDVVNGQGVQHKVNLEAIQITTEYNIRTYKIKKKERLLNAETTALQRNSKDAYDYEDVKTELRKTQKGIKRTVIIENIQSALLLKGEQSPQMELDFDGLKVTATEIKKKLSPIKLQVISIEENREQAQWIVKISTVREEKTFPNNDLKVDIKQARGMKALEVYVSNENCDSRDDSRFILVGTVEQPSSILGEWWVKNSQYFYSELLQQACKYNRIVLNDLNIGKGNTVRLNYHLIKADSKYFSEVQSATRWTSSIVWSDR